MMQFYFKAKNTTGKTVSGSYAAQDKMEVAARLANMNYKVISIKQASVFRAILQKIKTVCYQFTPISNTTISTFYYQLSGMLAIDLSIKKSLTTIADSMLNKRFAKVLYDMLADLSAGRSFGAAVKKYTHVFSNNTANLLALAKSRLDLMSVLNYSDEILQRKSFSRKLLFMILPHLALLVALLVVMIFLRLHYLRDFYYAAYVFNKPTPVIIHYFDLFSALFTIRFIEMVFAVLLIAWLTGLIFKSFSGLKFIYDSIVLRLPVVGYYNLLLQRERISLMVYTLLQGGETVQKALQFSSAAIDNRSYHKRFQRLLTHIKKGGELSCGLVKYKIFNAVQIQLVTLGVTANNLASTFGRVYNIDKLLIEKRLTLISECTRVFMYALNLFLLISLVVVSETLFFYASGP